MNDPYSISFEAFSVAADDLRVSIASGTRQYTTADVRTAEYTMEDGTLWWEKSLSLGSGFVVGIVMDSRLDDHDSLVLFVARESGRRGFSFDVFAEERGVFIHPELGQLKVSFLPAPSPDHIEGIEFLSDVKLRYLDDIRKDVDFTHEIVVQRGSLFRVQ
jgi:hypothetical protein